MPTYDYECPACQRRFDLTRPIKERNRRTRCPKCHAVAERVITAPGSGVWKRPITFDMQGPNTGVTCTSKKHLLEECKIRGKVSLGYG